MFPNCIDRLGHKKREKKQQQTNKEKPRKKINKQNMGIYIYIGRWFEFHSGQLSIQNRKTSAQNGYHNIGKFRYTLMIN